MVGARLIPSQSQKELQMEETNCGPRIRGDRRRNAELRYPGCPKKPFRNPQMKSYRTEQPRANELFYQ